MEEKQRKRCDECHQLGLKFNGEYYQDSNAGIFVHHTDILCYSDEEWNKMIAGIKDFRSKQNSEPLNKQ